MTLPAEVYDTLHALTAPDAQRIRTDWFGGGSGATITLAESERLHALFTRASEHAPAGIDVDALMAELRERTKRHHSQWAWAQAKKKAAKKAKRT